MASTSTGVVTVALPRIPRINDPAPDFEARSTDGIIRLSDYTSKGKRVLLFLIPRTSLRFAPRNLWNLPGTTLSSNSVMCS